MRTPTRAGWVNVKKDDSADKHGSNSADKHESNSADKHGSNSADKHGSNSADELKFLQTIQIPTVILCVIQVNLLLKYMHIVCTLYNRGESTSPGFYHFCVRQFMQFSLYWQYSLFFSFSVYFLDSHSDFVMPIKRK